MPLVIERSKLKIDMKDWTEAWINLLEEVEDRVRIELGQSKVVFHITKGASYHGAAIFNRKVGGDIIWGPVAINWIFATEKLGEKIVCPGDEVHMIIEWD